MKKLIIGFIAGVAIALSAGAFAVNMARDIYPLQKAVKDILVRLDALEAKCGN